MASIYEKTPFFKVQRTWDTKTVFPTTYKLQSNDFSSKANRIDWQSRSIIVGLGS
jgi:hypothetical protein